MNKETLELLSQITVAAMQGTNWINVPERVTAFMDQVAKKLHELDTAGPSIKS